MAVIAFAACRKPDPDAGTGLLPGDPLGTVIDTASLHAYTVADTSFRSIGLSKQLLGSFIDPEFGLTRAGIVTEVRLSAFNIGAGQGSSGLVADSLVLALAFDGANYGYGNLDAQVFRVHELGERLAIDSLYRSSRMPVTVGDDLLAVRGGRITPQPPRKPYILGDSLAPQLRLRLAQAKADTFLDAFGTSDLSSDEAFLEFFHGFYVTVDNSGQLPLQNGILYFDLLAAASKLTLYYRDQNDQPDLTRALDFPINANCVRYGVVEHDRSQATDPGLLLALADPEQPAQRTYVQTLAGTRTVISLASLTAYRGQRAVLAKAELVVPTDGSWYPYYPPPTQLFLFRKDAAGNDVFLPDQLTGIGAIDGNFRATDKEYRFNITRFAQGVIDGTYEDPELEVLPGSGGISANRVVLSGPAAAQRPMRLRLTFTSY